ncbi:transcriptional regulator [Actinomadura sp. WAC 06369]|nr:transcriptional regulator [Actinomadura sp. WAC 06369]
MRDRTPDPTDPDMTTGERIKFYRRRKGMTRAVLAGLVGRNPRWLKAVEDGQIKRPQLAALQSLAAALGLKDVGLLVGGEPVGVDVARGPGHPSLPAVREAINAVTIPSREPQRLDYLAARVDAAWRARHAAPDHRTVLGELLPSLITDARHASRAYEGADRRRALAILAGAYNVAQFYVAYQPDAGLLWRIAERTLMAAEESEDPAAFAAAVWSLAQAHRDAGDFDAAEQVNRSGLDHLRPRLEGGGDDLRALWGALHIEAGYTAARAGQRGAAWRWWEDADRIAGSLPAGYYQPMTSFSRVIMGAHAVTFAVELRQKGESGRQARGALKSAIPSRPRRGRHLIEVARAWDLGGDQAATVGTLKDAHRAAPETIRFNGYARRLVADLADSPDRAVRRDARVLADRIGILV